MNRIHISIRTDFFRNDLFAFLKITIFVLLTIHIGILKSTLCTNCHI